MRSHLHKEVRNRLVGEIPKTLTNHQLDEVEKIVRAEFGPEPETFTIR
jgi:protein required for attachment to host cells